jgi:hypothetical protein
LWPFAPRRLAFSSDGSLWALGKVHDDKYDDAPNYDMLRQYDSDGILVKTVLPNTAVPGSPPASTGVLRLQKDPILIPGRLGAERASVR